MTNRFFLATVGFLILFAAPAHAETSYTENDLQLLLAQENYREAITHLTDIPPTLRTTRWNQILVDAVVGRVAQLRKQMNCLDAWRELDAVVYEFPKALESAELKKTARETAVCAADEADNRSYPPVSPTAIMARLEKMDSSDETTYFLATNDKFQWTRNLLDLIERNPAKWLREKPAQAHLLELLDRGNDKDANRAEKLIAQHAFAEMEKDLRKGFAQREQRDLRSHCFRLLRDKGRLSDAEIREYHLEVFLRGDSVDRDNLQESLEYVRKRSDKDMESAVAALLKRSDLDIRILLTSDKEIAGSARGVFVRILPSLVFQVGAQCVRENDKRSYTGYCGWIGQGLGLDESANFNPKERRRLAEGILSQVVKQRDYDPQSQLLRDVLESLVESTSPLRASPVYGDFRSLVDQDVVALRSALETERNKRSDAYRDKEHRLDCLMLLQKTMTEGM